ncbi:neuronal PAS domain-containing protein 1 isoform X1 [Stegostoma tigrinum]|uniref:neuronal PAS domain-containing protein 1 isoform X1 n=1 Tax=Stegostoma tigrinum TaxID=3053191 RepID=UPI00202B481B|nr:neuronal PAS domain-containing protein 1 isoform X1 [Stegostoma tigrinum]XP_048378202.1 neuronal PAS domain-containing protein 1 isoform X1 [Stegostoma tigrinum]XP_048378203.1 neuronal PAS domain-containing protein 1 isoform X1 [Stegostoma tigrinum]XP_048378204.1 neuronal PAS domain-containing protein 1 isoform X1 [Stegostoma tigrinum]XP_048378205.1 neuronal PAS domain-containing protein 1 isoform X1 [Stegostoma tigrinum]
MLKMATQYNNELKCVSVEWDFLQGLLVKNQPVPCLQALRKEKSRNAARFRRGKENFEFYELAKMLPLPGAITSQLDKASIIRLTISYLRMRDFANLGDPPWNLRIEGPPPNISVKAIGSQQRRSSTSLAIELFEQHLGGHILQSLDGFIFALNREGKFLYISETVSIYLGLSQVELTGSSIFDYIHPGDHVEVAEQLGLKLPSGRGHSSQTSNEDGASSTSSSSLAETPESDSGSPSLLGDDNVLERTFFIRMKSTLTKRGVHVKSSGYKVIHVTGRLRSRILLPHARAVPTSFMGMVALAHTLPPSTINEVRIECHMFVSRVSLDLQIIYCENRISDYMDLSTTDVVGKNCYHFIHAEDVEGIRHSHLDLLNKGQVVTKYYRWMQKNGGYMWVQSSATISINVKNGNEKNIIWVNHVLSKPEHRDTPMDISQLPLSAIKTSKQLELSDSESDSREHLERDNPKDIGKRSNYEKGTEPRTEGWKRSASQSEEELTSAKDDSDTSQPDDSDSEGPSAGRRSFILSKVKRMKVEGDSEVRPAARESRSSLPSGGDGDTDSSEDENGGLASKPQYLKRKKRPRESSASRARSSDSPSPGASDFGGGGGGGRTPSKPTPDRISPLKIKTEATQPVNFDNNSAIWNFPPNREVMRSELPYRLATSEHFHPVPTLHVAIPDSVLTPPGGADASGGQKTPFSSPTSPPPAARSVLAAGGGTGGSSDALSPPLSGSPREDKAQAVAYAHELEMVHQRRLHAVLPLVTPHPVSGAGPSSSPSSSIVVGGGSGGPPPQGLYTTSTIRYAPADVALAMQGNLLPAAAAINFVDLNASAFGGGGGSTADSKAQVEMIYHHVQRLNMAGPFASPVGAAGLTQVPAGSVFTTAEALLSTLPFPMNTGSIHAPQTLERKED